MRGGAGEVQHAEREVRMGNGVLWGGVAEDGSWIPGVALLTAVAAARAPEAVSLTQGG